MNLHPSFSRRVGSLTGVAALAAAMVLPTAAAAQDGTAMVRVLHGAGDAPAVDVYADGALIGEGLAYTQITDYLEVPDGTYQIQVVPSGATLEDGPVVIDAPLTFEAGTMTTVAATGSLADGIVPQVLTDAPAPTADGTQVRVAHLSADAPAVDIAPDGAEPLITDLAYTADTGYLSLPAGAYDLEIRAAGTDTVAFDIPELSLDDATSYTVFAVGGIDDGSFTVVPAVDQALAGIRVGHFSADAPNVDVYANGGAILQDVPFGAISDYLYVPAGPYQIQVVPAGASLDEGPVVIDAELTFDGGSLNTVAATNDLANITPVVIEDAKVSPSADGAKVRVVHLSANAPKVDVAPDGSKRNAAIFKNLEFGQAKGYKNVPAGDVDLDIRAAGERAKAFDIPPLALEDGKAYSAIAIGQFPDTFDVILVEEASRS
jgi:Domain of unknown function (DUF4397)